MIKVSVIIPVYNGEMHLRQCLDSVCNQTLKEIEIICVDDGSTDSSFEILKEYQDKDNRIQLYQQQNLYAGVARNLGKSHATGEYLVFWDCDDFFELNALEEMYNRAVAMQADVCVCGANKYFEDKDKIAPNAAGYLTKKHVSGDVFSRITNEGYILNFTNAVPWNKMFRREFIEKLKLDYKPVRNGNDIYFTQCAIALAERITVLDKALVTYRVNQSGSLFGTLSKSPLIPFESWIAVAEDLKKLNAFPEQSFVNKVLGSIVYLLRNIKEAEAFATTVDFLKREGLEKLHVKEYEEEYFYTKWHYEFVKHLINDSLEDFRAYLSYETYIQLTERGAEKALQAAKVKEKNVEIKRLQKSEKALQKEVDSLTVAVDKQEKEIKRLQAELKKEKMEKDKVSKELKRICCSWSFKLGRAIVWLPSKVKRIFK